MNIAIGHETTLSSVVTGDNNVAIGPGCLYANTSGSHNVAIGTSGLTAHSSGDDNIGIGYLAGYSGGGTGSDCVYIGPNAGKNGGQPTDGDANTAIGASAMSGALSTGKWNLMLGVAGMNALSTGDNNIGIGYTAGNTGSPGGQVTTGDNGIFLGDENITEANIQVDWTIASDKRDKTDVNPMDLGLEFINQLEPVTYRWDKRSKYSDDQSAIPDGTHKEEQLEGGFLAQDVESLEEQYGHKFSDKTNLTFHLSEDEKMYGIKYGKFVPMLVKAVQELSAEVEELKEKLNGSN